MDRSFYLSTLLVIIVDWLLLQGTDMLFGSYHSWLRTSLGALLGGFHTALCLLPGFEFMNATIWRIIILATAGCFAFNMDLHRIAAYCLINIGIGGLVTSLARGTVIDMVFVFILIGILCFIGLQGRPLKHKFVPIQIRDGNEEILINALVDTGNHLQDPITGQSVTVVSAPLGCRLLGVDASVFSNPMESLTRMPGLRLIPYSTVGGTGLLLAKKFKDALVGNNKQDILIAFSPMDIGRGKGFNALMGGI